MKAALKWGAWTLVGLVAFGIFLSADKITQTIAMATAGLIWAVYGISKQVESLHKDMINRLERLYERVDHVSQECYSLERELSAIGDKLDGRSRHGFSKPPISTADE